MRGRSAWSVANVVLAVAILALLVTIGAIAGRSSEGRDSVVAALTDVGDPDANELTVRHRDVAEAARELTLAFLTVDHRDMKPLTEKVLAGATGEFKKEYAASVDKLIESAQENESLSTGEVTALGIGDMDGDSALVYVAADSEVENVSTEGTKQPRYYRIQLDMVLEDGAWRAAKVQFVG